MTNRSFPGAGVRPVRYDARAFYQFNYGVRRAITTYDLIRAEEERPRRPQAGPKFCAEDDCQTVLTYTRLSLCETHRRARELAQKRRK